MKKFFQDFKAFATKGNVIDMAVGVVIGGAFGKIVSSLVSDIITPLISFATGSLNFTDLKWVIKEAVPEVLNEAGEVITEAIPEVAMTYGNFLQAVIDFFIIALSIFVVLRIMMNAQKQLEELAKKDEAPVVEEAPAEPAAPVETELDVLKEIRDALKK